MGKNQIDKRNQDKTGNLSNEKTNEDYNKKHPDLNNPNRKEHNSNTDRSNTRNDNKETMVEDRSNERYFMQLNDDGHDETMNGEITY